MTIFLVDQKDILMRPDDVLREMAGINAAEKARESAYESSLLKRELLEILVNLDAGRITFEAAVEACRLLEKTAADPLLSQDEVETLWALCAQHVITWKELLFLVDIAQNDALRVKAEGLNNGVSRDRGSRER